MPNWTANGKEERCHSARMTSGGVLVVLFLLGIGALAVTTLLIAVRGGRGAGAPPASRPHVDPNGFPVLAPQQRYQRRSSRPVAARIAAVVHTARESRTARGMSAALGPRPSPSPGRTSTRVP